MAMEVRGDMFNYDQSEIAESKVVKSFNNTIQVCPTSEKTVFKVKSQVFIIPITLGKLIKELESKESPENKKPMLSVPYNEINLSDLSFSENLKEGLRIDPVIPSNNYFYNSRDRDFKKGRKQFV